MSGWRWLREKSPRIRPVSNSNRNVKQRGPNPKSIATHRRGDDCVFFFCRKKTFGSSRRAGERAGGGEGEKREPSPLPLMVFVARLQRLRGSGASILRAASLPNIKRKASNSWSAVQDTYLSTKDVFERHRVVFTTATSLASILTAWGGYSLRHYHQAKIEERLQSIEESVKTKNKIEHQEIKKIVSSGNVSTTACLATAWTCLLIGYGLGWRGGSWYANRKFRREQLKLMGQIKPKKWRFMKTPLIRSRILGVLQKPNEKANFSGISQSFDAAAPKAASPSSQLT